MDKEEHIQAGREYEQGLKYEFGRDVKRDWRKAFSWYLKASDNGHAEAAYRLGRCYEYGFGTPRDLLRAAESYWYAAENSVVRAQVRYGQFLLYGIGDAQDVSGAFAYFRQAADAGDIEGYFELAQCYEHGVGCDRDWALAWRLYEEAARGGWRNAQKRLGACFLYGIHIPTDTDKALYWLRLAAEQGDDEAAHWVGAMYLAGNGIQQDSEKGADFLKYARGVAPARLLLAGCYLSGDGVPHDEGEAAVLAHQEIEDIYSKFNSREPLATLLNAKSVSATNIHAAKTDVTAAKVVEPLVTLSRQAVDTDIEVSENKKLVAETTPVEATQAVEETQTKAAEIVSQITDVSSSVTVEPEPKAVAEPKEETVKPEPKTVAEPKEETVKPEPKTVVEPKEETVKPEPKAVVEPKEETVKPEPKAVVEPKEETVNPEPKTAEEPKEETVKPEPKAVVEPKEETVKPEPKTAEEPQTLPDVNEQPQSPKDVGEELPPEDEDKQVATTAETGTEVPKTVDGEELEKETEDTEQETNPTDNGEHEGTALYKEGMRLLLNKQTDAGFKLLCQSAEQDDSAALCQLGVCYETGVGCTVNTDTAAALYRRAADLGNPRAKLRVRRYEFAAPVGETGVCELDNFDLKVGDGLPMIMCPAGTFLMGSPKGWLIGGTTEKGRNENELRHQVTLTNEFWLGKYPVTQEVYADIADRCGIPSHPAQFHGRHLPVETVSWEEAMTWCRHLTELERAAGRLPEQYEYRLPTEAEWEYACRAGKLSPFNDGSSLSREDGTCDALQRLAWFRDNSNELTHPVGELMANVWGFHDMHGNVSEWCIDKYDDYVNSQVTDPVGGMAGHRRSEGSIRRCRRGGSWQDAAKDCRSASRAYGSPGFRRPFIGFRLVLGYRMTSDVMEDRT